MNQKNKMMILHGYRPGICSPFLLCLLLSLSLFPLSCQFPGERNGVKVEDEIEEENVADEVNENKFFKKALRAADVTSEPLANEIVTVEDMPIDSVKELERLQLSKETAKLSESGKFVPFYEKYLNGKEDELVPFSLNTDALTLEETIEFFAGELGFGYILDPNLKSKGAITIAVDTQLSKRDMWKLFEHVLWLSGAYCSPGSSNILNIYPFAMMPQERKIFEAAGGGNVEVKIFPLKNVAPKDVMDKLKPFLTDNAQMIEIQAQNGIMLVEAPQNLPKIEFLVSMLDKQGRANWPEAIINCSNMQASVIKDELLTIMPVLGFPVAADSTSAEPGAIQITANDRLQVIIASAANVEAIDELKKWISILDRSDIGEQERVFVYKVVNGKSQDLLSAVSAIFNTEASSVSASSSSLSTSKPKSTIGSSSKTTDQKQQTPTTPSQLQQPKSTSTKSSSSSQQGDKKSSSIFDVPAKIFADEINNRLVVRTTPRTYAMIKALLVRLDSVPAQVFLQVMIAEAILTESTQFGLEFSNKVKYQNASSVYGTDFKELNPGGNDQTGFKYWVQNSNDPENKFAYIRAVAGTGNVKVLSSPQIVAVSHTTATIQVGDKVPILVSTITSTASAGEQQNAVQYQDTGIILNIIPHVTEGGLIVIELDQTVSDAIKTTSSQIDSPTIQERTLKTSLALRDGGTLIVGGMISERNTMDQQSMPFIAKIPLLASLAGYTDNQKKRIELLVMITGTVITEKTDLEQMTKRYSQAIRILKEAEK